MQGGLVLRAQRAWRAAPDTRALKRELANGNPYALELIRRHGSDYVDGAIIRRPRGYAAEVIADSGGKWAGNTLVFETAEEAAAYVADLARRWTLVRDTRVIEVDRPANYRWNDGRPARIENA